MTDEKIERLRARLRRLACSHCLGETSGGMACVQDCDQSARDWWRVLDELERLRAERPGTSAGEGGHIMHDNPYYPTSMAPEKLDDVDEETDR